MRNVLVWFSGTNDIWGSSDSADTIITSISTACAARKAAGWQKVIVATILPRGPGNDANETKRQTVNASIRANYATYADGLVDIGNDATIGQATQNSNTTYYNADQIHPSEAGHAIIAGYMKTATDAAFA